MKGRKPVKDAIRRGGRALVLEPEIVDTIQKPDEVLANPDMSDLWDQVVRSGLGFKEQDIPFLVQYVFYLNIARTCRAQLTAPDGRSVLLTMGVGEKNPDGTYNKYIPNPLLKQLDHATTQILKLADQLGTSPLARARLGITETAQKSMQVDIVAKMNELLDAKSRAS